MWRCDTFYSAKVKSGLTQVSEKYTLYCLIVHRLLAYMYSVTLNHSDLQQSNVSEWITKCPLKVVYKMP